MIWKEVTKARSIITSYSSLSKRQTRDNSQNSGAFKKLKIPKMFVNI
jgi:hypothetical protein